MEKWEKLKRYSVRKIQEFKKDDANIELKTTVQTDKKNIIWTIENVTKCSLKQGEYIESAPFYTGRLEVTKWCLRFYPKGRNSPNSDPKFVGVFLYKITPSTKVLVQIKMNDGQAGQDSVEWRYTDKLLCEEPEEIGTDKFFKSENLSQNFVIYFGLDVGYMENENIFLENDTTEDSSDCTISKDFGKLYKSGKFTDVTLQVGKKQFPAHKAVLAARSNVFFSMFEHDMKESQTNLVTMDEFEPSLVDFFLQYIYSGKIEKMDVDKAIQLFPLGDKYDLTDLQKLCSEVMLRNMSVKNVCKIVALADLHSIHKLKNAALYFIRNHSSEVLDMKEFKDLTLKSPALASEIWKNITRDYKNDCLQKN